MPDCLTRSRVTRLLQSGNDQDQGFFASEPVNVGIELGRYSTSLGGHVTDQSLMSITSRPYPVTRTREVHS
jgi:hypothetical protein